MSTTYDVKWAAPEAIVTALTTELNSLANGEAALTAAIANETGLYPYIDLELYMASVDIHTQTALYLSVWFLSAVDSTPNYEDGSNTGPMIPARPPDVVIPVRAGSGAMTQRVNVVNIPIPPLGFEILIQNNIGAALAASGNTLKYRRHNMRIS